MATYKVLQDIEAEDKLIGPLTLRQFIYALVGALNGYLTFVVITKGVPFMAIIFIPLTLICAFFSWPWSRDQPTEVWALAKIRFMVKPRKRIWNQSGIKELVTITAPKRIEQILTNGLSENEVQSRLKALADTIDSRGWAIKNVNVSMYGQPAMIMNAPSSDRLINVASLPQPVPTVDVRAADDMLDVQNNPVAQQFDTMIAASAKAHRQQIMERMQAQAASPAPVAPPAPAPTLNTPTANNNNYWFLNQPSQMAPTVPQDTVTFNTQVVAPGTTPANLPVTAANPTPDEESFIKKLKNEPAFSPNMHGHLHVIQPLSAQGGQTQQTPVQGTRQPQTTVTAQAAASQPAPKVTQQPDAAILDLARNDDLNVATIAREANKRKEPPQDEVVISLH
ncbi:MAG TPA: PrgI family protein [Candidatus Saccharimonadales bacterium]|nr:PrgI family protein [Candidatus Saccharimonadales bacterium]